MLDKGKATGMTAETDDPDLTTWFVCNQFLIQEAACLDENRIDDWLDLLTTDIRYEVPIMLTRHRTEDPIAPNGWHMKENLGSLKTRAARLYTESAWGEDPPTRTRRLIGNVRPTTWSGDEITVKSNLLLYLGRGDSPEHSVLTAERQDHIKRTDEGLRLARRMVLLSHTTLPIQSIGVFL